MRKLKTKTFRSARSMWFYIGFMALPILQFCIFYIGVNVNSFLLAFKDITFENGAYVFKFTFDNFKNWFADPNEFSILTQTFLVSIKSYFVMLIGVPLGLFFAYYIFKKLPGAMFFRFMLFLPSIISSIVLVTVYRYFVAYVVPELMSKVFGFQMQTALLDDSSTRYATVMFYNLFVSFGTTVLLYSNKMSSIPPEIIEAANLDGANSVQEFFRIVLPQTYSTLSVFLVTGVAGIFINEINNFSFFNYKWKPDTATLGFLMYYRVQRAKSDITQYPSLAALGLTMTAVAVPLTFVVRKLLYKFGPSED